MNVEFFDLAAELAFDFQRKQSLHQVELNVSRPTLNAKDWQCTFVVDGLLSRIETVTARESLHALCLAIRRIHGFLSATLQEGQLYCRDQRSSRTLIPLELKNYFHAKLEEG